MKRSDTFFLSLYVALAGLGIVSEHLGRDNEFISTVNELAEVYQSNPASPQAHALDLE